ncbi:MAG TPA: AAA family ATPase, partial [Terriglobales bacterium]|nr:AAA family ATPase [Terriglobales bacterium]
MATEAAAAEVRQFAEQFQRIRAQVGRVVIGHEELLDEILIAFFAGGHVLIEGVPGIGKTLIVRTLAQVLNLSFSRIQFTIDLMPGDITGTRMLLEDGGQRRLAFVPGPLFAHVLLADEINR